ncbi:S8 family peptidase, partial [Streptomyces sp. SID7982]|nr:S8 family peptidase [Streptomyces sp. SID7982]
MRLPARWATAALLLIAPMIAIPAPASADSGPEGVTVEQSTRAVPGQYIVTLEPELSPDTVLRELGLDPLFRYGNVLHGFAATLTAAELEAVRTVP